MSEITDSDLPEVSRWTLIRDLGVFQVKLLVDGLRDLLLVPASLVAGIASIVSGKAGGAGPQFYHLLEWGKESEHWIDLFSALKNSPERIERPEHLAEQGMDDIVERLETFMIAEYKGGGLTAQAKEHFDTLLKTMRGKSAE